MKNLTVKDIYSVLVKTLPEQNDFFKTDYCEELEELLFLGINTKALLLDLILKHREALLDIDSEELDVFHIKYYSEEYGEEFVNTRVNNRFWFSYSALLRIALELEFGDRYLDYLKNKE